VIPEIPAALLVLSTLVVLVLLRMPVVFAIGAAVCLYFLQEGLSPANIGVRMGSALDSSVLIAIPLYLMAGEFMNRSGATARLVRAAETMLSWMRGGLAQTNILSSLIFAGMSGSALADSAGIGKIMIPAMKDRGYDAGFSAAVTASSSIIGPVFPPSIPMIVFASITGTSVGALFLAGVLPGLALTGTLMVWVWFATRRMDLKDKSDCPLSARVILRALGNAALPMTTPVIILSGIFGGFMTPTEAGAIAAFYAAVLGLFVYRSLTFRDLFEGMGQAMMLTAAVMALLAVAAVLGWVITLEGIARDVSAILGGRDASYVVVVFVIVTAMLLIGMFMDSTAAMLVFVPVFSEVALDAGLLPLQFGMLVILALLIGLITPPVGFCLFVTASIAEIPVTRVIRATLPLILPILLVLAAIAAFPAMTMWLPSIL
jgi:tripartite ATP-independent transporter DctM subunit